MDVEENLARNRHNSNRSRHGSGRGRHDSGKIRHSSGDILRRLENELSPKIKHESKAKINGYVSDEEKIALIGVKDENGACSPIEIATNDIVSFECRENCDQNGDCRGTCSRENLPGIAPIKQQSEKNVKNTEGVSFKTTPSKNPTMKSQAPGRVKKSSDSEGDSDNPINGGTDGEDDHQLLIRSKSASKNTTSPPWKNRSRHSSSDGLRKRTRSRSDSEPSETILSSERIGELPGIAPLPETKYSKNMSPSKLATKHSRRRRTTSQGEQSPTSCDKELTDNTHDLKGGSLGCSLHMCDETHPHSLGRQRHKSMDSAGIKLHQELRIKPLLDNPSFVHKRTSTIPETGLKTDSVLSKPNSQSSPVKSIPSSEHCSMQISPCDEETNMLINDNTSSPSPKASPRINLELKLANVYRPRGETEPPLHILHQDPSFSPPTLNHIDANHKLNGDPPHKHPDETIRGGNIWHLKRISDERNFINGDCHQIKDIDLQSPASVSEESSEYGKQPRWQTWVTLSILLLANLINYMDRVTIAGVLGDIKDYYGISNTEAGLLQTSFIVSYMFLSPVFGYLGDRYNRKVIMAIGIAFWSSITLAGSFIPHDKFWLFVVMRGLVGVGEASYSTIAPTIIADLFVKDMRTKALAVFYFAIPVGSGLGYIAGSNVAALLGAWQWSLRVTPGLGVLCVICIIVFVREPARGQSEGGTHLGNTSWTADLIYLAKNKSFILSTLGFTCVAFVTGALALWAPLYLGYAIRIQGNYSSEAYVGLIFGVITCLAGFLGVGIGSETARRLRSKSLKADPLVCAFGLISCSPFLYLMIVFSKYNIHLTWVLIFIGETLLCLNWAIVTDIVLYIVIPTRRSTAEAVQILVSHLLGDAGSPYLIGVIADSVKAGMPERGEIAQEFISLQYSMYICCFVALVGGACFLATSNYIVEDRARADKAIKGGQVVMLQGSTSTSEEREEDSDDAMIVVGGNNVLAINAPNARDVLA